MSSIAAIPLPDFRCRGGPHPHPPHFSVMMAVMYFGGVRSKAGLLTRVPSGVICQEPTWGTSPAERSSISSPVREARSIVGLGATA